MLAKVIKISVLAALFPAIASAQISDSEGSTGSVYSGLGLGLPVDFRSPIAEGMGLNGVTVMDSDVGNLSNPAIWGNTVLTRGIAGFIVENFDAKNESTEMVNTLFTPHFFQLQFPLEKDKLGFSLSMAPITRSDFRTLETVTLLPSQNPLADSVNVALENRRNGGLNRFEMGIGWKINKNISVGYAGSVFFGTTTTRIATGFEDFRFEDVNTEEQISHVGFGNRFGVLYNKESVLRKNDKLTAGLTFNLPVDLEADREVTADLNFNNQNGQLVFQTLDLPMKEGADDGEFRFPLQAAVGATYQINEVWSVASDLTYQQWSEYENFEGETEDFMKDRYKVGIGASYYPFRRNSQPFFSKFKYRAGVSYDSGHLKFSGNNIDALFINAGFSFLSRGSRSSIDFNFHYGIRGTRADNLVKENIMGMKITFNLSELMFERRKFR